MRVSKPKRKFLVRIIDLESGKSKNFSIYDTRISLEKLYRKVIRALEFL